MINGVFEEVETVALLIFTLLTGIILRLPYIKTPLDRDYGIYGYHALFWLQKKKIPYVDTSENHPPGRWLLYTLLLRYFKPSRALFRISNIIFLLLIQLVVFFISEHLFGITVGLVSSLVFSILSTLPAFLWVQSSDEIQQAFFTTLTIYGIIALPVGNFLVYYFIGIFAFMALFFKQSAYVNTFPVVLLLLIIQKTSLVNVSFLFLGILSGFTFTLLFFKSNTITMHHYKFIFALNLYSFKTHLDNLFYFKKVLNLPKVQQKFQTIVNNQVSISNEEKSETGLNQEQVHLNTGKTKKQVWIFHPWTMKIFRGLFLQTNVFVFFGLMGMLMVVCHFVSYHGYFGICLWAGAAIVTVLLNQHLMPYHFIPLLSPIAILSAVGMVGSFAWLNESVGIWFSIPIFLGVFSGSIFLMKNEIKDWLAREKKGRGRIYTHGDDWELNSVGELIGKYLNTKTNPGDQIYVWGHEYEIYLWAQRSSPTQTLFCPRPEISFSTDPHGEELQIVLHLENTPPKYIVICAYTEGFKRFESLLQQHYYLERKVFGEIGLYRRIVDPVPEKYLQAPENTEVTENTGTIQQRNSLVSVIILTCNVLKYTKMCVRSIQNHTAYPHEIIFVDNASTDGTTEYLQRLVEQNRNYKLIRNSENKGFAAGNNQGVAAASGEYVMLLNNDVLVSDGWLESLVKSLEQDENIGMVGPITNYISGRQAIKDVPYKDENGFSAFAKKVRELNRGKVTPRRRIAGFAVLMKKAVYEEVGGLDETFGIGNFEDDDLCVKVFRRGYAIMVDESTFVHHFGSQTFKANRIDYNQNLKERLTIFNKKWPDVDYEELLELKESLVNVNASLLIIGKQALDAGNTDEALETFSKILRMNPIDTGALSGICFAYLMKGNMDQALDKFMRMLEIVPTVKGKPIAGDLSIKLFNKAEDLSQEGKYNEAIDTYKETLKINPSFFKAYYNLALVYTNVNQIDDAISTLKKAIALDDGDASVYNNLGVLYFKKNRYDDAKVCFEKALSIDSHYHEAIQNLKKVSDVLKNSVVDKQMRNG